MSSSAAQRRWDRKPATLSPESLGEALLMALFIAGLFVACAAFILLLCAAAWLVS